MSKPDNLANIPRCHHLKDDGVRCGSPALRGKRLCYFHDRWQKTFPHRRPSRFSRFCRTVDFFNVQTPDDVTLALNRVMNALLNGQLSHEEAGTILLALQTAIPFAPYTTAAHKQNRRAELSRDHSSTAKNLDLLSAFKTLLGPELG